MAKSNRRSFLAKAPALAVATVGASAAAVHAKDKPAAKAPVKATPAPAPEKPEKKVHWTGGKRPEETPLFSSVVSYGNLVFISGIGAHFEGDIKAHTDHVLKEIQKKLEDVGSSMEKVLKVNVYLSDAKDYAPMNEVFRGRFGSDPGVRTTIAAAWIPGNSLVEIDCIAYI